MLRSMTGFGSARAQVGTEEITVEIRSVNGKFCEVKTRLPRELFALESEVVRLVKERLARGSVDVSLRHRPAGESAVSRGIDEALATRLAESFRSLRDKLGLAGEVSLSDVIGVEGVITVEERTLDLAAAKAAVQSALQQALAILLEMREREGAALEADLAERLGRIRRHASELEEQAPQAVIDQRDRIARRVDELTEGVGLDPQRLAQEVALLADRSDITEELTRLGSHIAQFEDLLRSTEPVGRRLDFLVQELNREVNTIASKASWSEAATITVELKADLERIREQIQNVE